MSCLHLEKWYFVCTTSSLWRLVKFFLDFLIWSSTVLLLTVPYVIDFLALKSFNSLLTSHKWWHVIEKGWLIPIKLKIFIRETKSISVKFKNTTVSLFYVFFLTSFLTKPLLFQSEPNMSDACGLPWFQFTISLN